MKIKNSNFSEKTGPYRVKDVLTFKGRYPFYKMCI